MKLWIARDLDGALWLYDKEPVKGRKRFNVKMFTHSYRISSSNFPEVTFENSPQQVEIKLI
jgi:hypothetical protein